MSLDLSVMACTSAVLSPKCLKDMSNWSCTIAGFSDAERRELVLLCVNWLAVWPSTVSGAIWLLMLRMRQEVGRPQSTCVVPHMPWALTLRFWFDGHLEPSAKCSCSIITISQEVDAAAELKLPCVDPFYFREGTVCQVSWLHFISAISLASFSTWRSTAVKSLLSNFHPYSLLCVRSACSSRSESL